MNQGVRQVVTQTPSQKNGVGQLLADSISHMENILKPFRFRASRFLHPLIHSWPHLYYYHSQYFASEPSQLG